MSISGAAILLRLFVRPEQVLVSHILTPISGLCLRADVPTVRIDMTPEVGPLFLGTLLVLLLASLLGILLSRDPAAPKAAPKRRPATLGESAAPVPVFGVGLNEVSHA